MQNKGLIWASDRAEWRLKNLAARAAWVRRYSTFASRLGTAVRSSRRKPSSMVCWWTRRAAEWERGSAIRIRVGRQTLQDVKELAAIQKQLLTHAAPSVKPGGKLIFAVCTLTRAETTEVAADFNAKFASDFEPLVQDVGLTQPNSSGRMI